MKERLFDLLKQYASERDVEQLASTLPEILINEEHQQLIDSIRYCKDYRWILCQQSRWLSHFVQISTVWVFD